MPTITKADDLKVKLERVTDVVEIPIIDKHVNPTEQKSFEPRVWVDQDSQELNEHRKALEQIRTVINEEYNKSSKAVREIFIGTKEEIRELKRTITRISVPINIDNNEEKHGRGEGGYSLDFTANLISTHPGKKKLAVLINETIEQSNKASQMIILTHEHLVISSTQKLKKSIKRYETVF